MKRALLFLVFFALSCSTSQQSQYVIVPGPAGSIMGLVTTDGVPLPGVTVTVQSTDFPTRTAVTDANGRYTFLGLTHGRYVVTTRLEGLMTQSYRVEVTAKQGVALATEMHAASVTETITVTASAPSEWLPATHEYERRRKSPPPQHAAVPLPAPAAPAMIVDGLDAQPAAGEHGFVDTKNEAVATFAIDVDRASYANVRRYLLDGVAPPPESIRIEEMLNYFTYAYPQPADDVPFSVTTEVAGCPWNPANRLVRVGIQGRNLEQWRMAPNNLVFLLDVSGSMDERNRLPLIQQAFRVLTKELRAEDRVAIVVYAGAAGLVLPSTSGADKATILAAIDQLQAGGSTAGGEGINLAYAVAQQNFLPDGNNRVILATDGDFNVGVTSMHDLEKLIEAKRQSDVFLSVIGVGDIWHDAKMEMLADKGNGNYSYLDSMAEAEKVFRHELTGTLVTIAKDVKVQLDFDPATVKSYRQIGYENRALAAKDFDDDTKDAGELGAGHSVTALFEVVPATSNPGRLATLRLRYKEPTGKSSKPLIAEVVDEGKSAYDASPDLQFAAAVAEMGMLLRNSPHKGSATWDDVFQLARVSQGVDLDGTRTEFVKLAQTARGLR